MSKYIIREIFTAKPGQASKLAKLFKKGFINDENSRVMTDFVGEYNTVVMEVETDSLAEWEKEMIDYRSGKADPKIDEDTAKEMAMYTDMYMSGRREIFQILE